MNARRQNTDNITNARVGWLSVVQAQLRMKRHAAHSASVSARLFTRVLRVMNINMTAKY